MTYNQLLVYYFSGTGNARNAANWIYDLARNNGMETCLINIDRFKHVEVPDLKGKTLIGFCTPTHGFNVPPIVLKYLWKFPRLEGVDTFILNTRAGMKLHKLFLPGLSGIAQLLPALILRLKGFRVVGMQPLDLPSNWLSIHPGLKQSVVQSIYSRCKRIAQNFAQELFDGKRKYKALLSLPFDIALIPVAMAYYFIGRFFLAKTLVATYECNNCDLCIKKCPVEAIVMVRERPFWTYRCESCMRCVNNCPKRAIETVHSMVGIVVALFSLGISPILLIGLEFLGVAEWLHQSVLTENLWSLIRWVIFLFFVFGSYFLFHLLMRFKFFNYLIAYSSFSKYKFWRRYKAPR